MINTVSLYTHWKQLVQCIMYYDQYCIVVHTLKTTRSLYYVLWSILYHCTHTEINSFTVLCNMINTVSLYIHWKQLVNCIMYYDQYGIVVHTFKQLVHCIMYYDQYCIIVHTLKTTRSLYYVMWSIRYRCTHTENNSYNVLCTMINTVSLYTHCKQLVHCIMYYDQYCIIVHTL